MADAVTDGAGDLVGEPVLDVLTVAEGDCEPVGDAVAVDRD